MDKEVPNIAMFCEDRAKEQQLSPHEAQISRDEAGHAVMAIEAFRSAQDEAWRRGGVRLNAAQFDALERKDRSQQKYSSSEKRQLQPFDEVNDSLHNEHTSHATKLTPLQQYELQPSPGFANRALDWHYARRSPQRVSRALKHCIRSFGWEESIETATVLQEWSRVAGPKIDQHTVAESYSKGTLTVRARTTAWSQALRYEIPQLMERCDKMMSAKVHKLIILPPKGPSWKYGPYHVKGRGPRDTYG
ncbi:MAG: DciA family protein [Actinomycetaceae bacterium]|nr:DciA family protein [Actinomycetaceae bacterium]